MNYAALVSTIRRDLAAMRAGEAGSGPRYCCRCGVLLETEPHYCACAECGWTWPERCPAKTDQSKVVTVAGVMCGECHEEVRCVLMLDGDPPPRYAADFPQEQVTL